MQQAEIESLYRSLAPKVTNYLVANGTPYAAACDIVQETFQKLWNMRDDLEGDESRISMLCTSFYSFPHFNTAGQLRKVEKEIATGRKI